MSAKPKPVPQSERDTARAKTLGPPSVPPAFGRVLELAPTHKAVRTYYDELAKLAAVGAKHEGAVRDAFSALLRHCAAQFGWTLVPEHQYQRRGRNPARIDGALLNKWGIARIYWEAKDSDDDLDREVKKKIADGYPTDNIIFQAPTRAIIYQNGRRFSEDDLTDPQTLVDVLKSLFKYEAPPIEEWERAADEFGEKVPELARALVKIIAEERKKNREFVQAFTGFCDMCRRAINPNIGDEAVEKMLVQHLLTERIFRKVFDNPDFAQRNVIAVEIEKVIRALTSRSFNRDRFLANLDRFYTTLERTAAAIDDYSGKQSFLNRVYERFFQGFDEKAADTHGIIYTPQSIVQFMVRSVDEILRKEFGKSLGDQGVHIIDPFVGTGNYILHVMRAIPRTRLTHKYRSEVHANEVMLLPYYVAAMNIEHEYAELTGQYEPFEGLCLVDTFELAEAKQLKLDLMSEANSRRVQRQKQSPIFVVLGNPPYNAWQQNDNDRNKNRKYDGLDERVAETYSRDSTATLKNSLSDPYVKAFRWAADRIGEEGIVAYVSNGSYVDGLATDGMRKHLRADFDAIYLLDLGGNVRKNPKLSGTTHNVFGIQVGVTIGLFVRRKAIAGASRTADIFYASTGEDWRKEAKYEFLDKSGSVAAVQWRRIMPTPEHVWINAGDDGFRTFLPMVSPGTPTGSQEALFVSSSNGIMSQRDSVVWNFGHDALIGNVQSFCEGYSAEARRYAEAGRPADLDGFLETTRVKWSDTLKAALARGTRLTFDRAHLRRGMYRPFTKSWLYFAPTAVDRPGKLQRAFPTSTTQNRVIWLKTGAEVPMFALMAAVVVDRMPQSGSQCFPLYTFDEDGTTRRDNVTRGTVEKFRSHYSDQAITGEAVFHYVYAILHHPSYCSRYETNLKRELPRIPFTPNFWAMANAGERLAELHIDYEKQPEWSLVRQEDPDARLDWRVEKMRLSRDKRSVIYNNFLTLTGIPDEAHEYKLGNRSALEWVIDQYQVSTDKRSGITNDPNRDDDPEYIVRLIGQVVYVSVETVKIVRALPPIDAEESAAPQEAKPGVRKTAQPAAKARKAKGA